MKSIKRCDSRDVPVIFEIINESAVAYKGVIPADQWHEPYMPLAELQSEIGKGVQFYGCYHGDRMVGVMGVQDVKDVTLIRHAYVRTEFRSQGIGRSLLENVNQRITQPTLVGAWKAASWAIRFYERNGFVLVGEEEKNRLLRCYWTISDRQIEESVVLRAARQSPGGGPRDTPALRTIEGERETTPSKIPTERQPLSAP